MNWIMAILFSYVISYLFFRYVLNGEYHELTEQGKVVVFVMFIIPFINVIMVGVCVIETLFAWLKEINAIDRFLRYLFGIKDEEQNEEKNEEQNREDDNNE